MKAIFDFIYEQSSLQPHFYVIIFWNKKCPILYRRWIKKNLNAYTFVLLL